MAVSYEEWSAKVRPQPLGAGGAGCLLITLTLAATGLCAWFGLALFGPGNYPRIVLAVPGLIGGWLFFVFGGRLIHALLIRGRSSPPG